MALERRVEITCDVHACPLEYVDDRRGAARSQAEKRAKEIGWHTSGGKDICPDHWEAGYRYGRDGWTVG